MSDLMECIPKSDNAVTNKSIIRSLGFLYYKNEDVLNAFCDTLLKESINYKLQDYFSILQTFAALQYKSERLNPFIEVRKRYKNFFILYAKNLELFFLTILILPFFYFFNAVYLLVNLSYQKFIKTVNPFQIKAIEWLDVVWSLAVLDVVQPQQIESVLEPTFITNLLG